MARWDVHYCVETNVTSAAKASVAQKFGGRGVGHVWFGTLKEARDWMADLRRVCVRAKYRVEGSTAAGEYRVFTAYEGYLVAQVTLLEGKA